MRPAGDAPRLLPAQLGFGSQVPASVAAAESLQGRGKGTFLPCNPELLPSDCRRGPLGTRQGRERLRAAARARGGRAEPGREPPSPPPAPRSATRAPEAQGSARGRGAGATLAAAPACFSGRERARTRAMDGRLPKCVRGEQSGSHALRPSLAPVPRGHHLAQSRRVQELTVHPIWGMVMRSYFDNWRHGGPSIRVGSIFFQRKKV